MTTWDCAAAEAAIERVRAWRRQLDVDQRAWFERHGHEIPDPLFPTDEDVLINEDAEQPLVLADFDAVLAKLEQLEQGRDNDVRAVDAYLIAAAVGGEQAAVGGRPLLALRDCFIWRIAELRPRDRKAEQAARDKREQL